MKECQVIQVDAFTRVPGQGNPAGVVLNGDDFTAEEMQQVAKEIGFNETVFICESQMADHRLRYFTPGHETPLCGHATVAAVFILYRHQGDYQLTLETGAGLLPVCYSGSRQEVTLTQGVPQFRDFTGSSEMLCESLGIDVEDLHPFWPIEYGNTGSWTLIVPVKSESILARMTPQASLFPGILKEMPQASVHPFAPLSIEAGNYYGRHFSSPFSGTEEDSVTGTASGVMGAYLMTHCYQEPQQRLMVYQGKHVQREGEVLIDVKRGESMEVLMTGTAVMNQMLTCVVES